MKINRRILISLVVVLCCITVILAFVIFKTNNKDGHVHQWNEWQVIQAASCESEGKQMRSCDCGETEETDISPLGHLWGAETIVEQATCSKEGSVFVVCSNCGLEEYKQSPKTEHKFTSISEWSEDGAFYVASSCEFCEERENTHKGIFFEEEEELHLIDCGKNFNFDVESDKGIDYIYKNLHIWRSFYTNLNYEENPELFEKFTVTNISGNRYRISPSSSYTDNMTYSLSLPEDITFIEYPTQSISFTIEGNNDSEVEYKKDIVFLKQLEINSPGYYPYRISYDESNSTYELILKKQGVIDQSYIGKVLCVGDCSNFEEANLQPPNTVILGKISDISIQGDKTRLTLTAPALNEVYSKLKVNSGITDISAEILSIEQKNILSTKLLKSDTFASAITSANMAAQSYAFANNFAVGKSALSLDNISFDIKVENGKNKDGTINSNQAVATILVKYKHSVPVKQSGVDLGSIDFDINFNTTVTFTLDLYNNLEYYDWWDWNYKLYLDLALYQETETEFNLSSSLNLKYTYSSETYYIINPNSGIIHSFDCRMCYNYRNNTACRSKYAEVIDIPNYLDYECQICKPFTMDDSGFVLNLDTNVLHCINCESAKNIKHNNVLSFSVYPLDRSVNNCDNCNPQKHTKSLNEYLAESVKSSDWGIAFDLVKASIGDVLKGNGASPIDENTRPRLTLTVYCFEVPVFIEPNFDFDLKANFKFKYETSVTDVYLATLHYNMEKDENGKPKGYEFLTRTSRGSAKTEFDLDLSGQARAEIGVIVEFRFGLKYLSDFIYVGLNGEIGAYTELSGVLHASSKDQNYYAARVEAGLYYQSSLTYAISGILDPNSQTIIAKTDVPFYKAGDTKAYYAFADYDQEIILNSIASQKLSNSLLNSVYYDLNSMAVKTEELNWLGNEQYSLSYRFLDKSGKTVDYCYIKNGELFVSDSAPDKFEIIMYVTIVDNIVPKNFLEYVSTPNDNGSAFFLGELPISIIIDNTVEIKTPNQSDFDAFVEMFEDSIVVWDNSDNFTSANLTTTEIIDDYITDYMFCYYLTLFDGDTITKAQQDPLNKLSECRKFEGDKIDWILENIFNKAPDHKSSSKYHYYYDGNWYVEGAQGVGDHGMIVKSISEEHKQISGNKYQITIKYIFDNYYTGETEKWEYVFVTNFNYDKNIGNYWSIESLSKRPLTTDTTTDSDDNENNNTNKEENPPLQSSEGLEYELNSAKNAYTVVGLGTCTDSNIVIGDTYNNLPVVVIGDKAFEDCDNITSVTIGSNVTNISYYAFYNCTGLKSVTFAESSKLMSIDQWAFYNCTELKSITIPSSVTSIGESAFFNCTGLKSVTFVESSKLMSIDQWAFSDCTGLESITIPDSVMSIGYHAFTDCTGLESITLPFVGETKDGTDNTNFGYVFGASNGFLNDNWVPKSLKTVIITGGESIDDYAFMHCMELESVTIPNSITSIGERAFYNCTNLQYTENNNGKYLGNDTNPYVVLVDVINTDITSFTIPTTTKVICYSAFDDCTGLTSITIPNSVTSIGYEAFYGCTGLTSITIPSGIKSIGEYAFSGCAGLTEINFNATAMNDPSDIESVFDDAGEDGSGITVNIGANVTKIPAHLFSWSSKITSVVFAEESECESIGAYAFEGMELQSITIPSSVTIIEKNAFAYAEFTSITIPSNVTSIGEFAFDQCIGLERIEFNGTTTQWNAISKGDFWNQNTPATKVVCSNGEVKI